MRRSRRPWCASISPPRLLFVAHVLLCSVPGIFSARTVNLGWIEIFTTHELLPVQPIVYFRCQGENKTFFPDVKKKEFLYTFNGEESWQVSDSLLPHFNCDCWHTRPPCHIAIDHPFSCRLQPLTELPDKKCKRCGVYEQDTFKSDDVYDEWELCAGSFVDGKYVHFKENQFNATFLCSQCTASDVDRRLILDLGILEGVHGAPDSKNEASSGKGGNIELVIVVCIFVSVTTVATCVILYKYWQKRKREQDQARFLKLFEEGDDIEDELGLYVT